MPATTCSSRTLHVRSTSGRGPIRTHHLVPGEPPMVVPENAMAFRRLLVCPVLDVEFQAGTATVPWRSLAAARQ